MSLRLGAALCGAAFMFCCSQAAIAKTSPHSGREAKPTSSSSSKGIVGKASTYNPLNPGDYTSGGLSTASGEKYNPNDWTAAIQTTLRHLFGGVSFGKSCRPVFALVEVRNKKAVVRINDVGPLKPGRVIDLNERVMRYFDPSMALGVLPVKVTPLAGDHVPGPTSIRVMS
jgi:rare lipoprotein A